jgi:hypothetical protein
MWVVVNSGTMPLGSLARGGAAERVGLPATLFLAGVAGAGIGLLAIVTHVFTGSRQAPPRDAVERVANAGGSTDDNAGNGGDGPVAHVTRPDDEHAA